MVAITSPSDSDLTVKKSLKLPEDLAKAAENRCRKEMRSFNNYVNWLIARDVNLEPEKEAQS